MAEEIVHYTVTEPGCAPSTGRYLATRRKDGFYLSEVKTSTGKIRKFVNPNHVSNVRTMPEVRLIDKVTDL